MELTSLRKNLFKEAVRQEVAQKGALAGSVLLGGAAALTLLTAPILAPVYVAGAVGVGAVLGIAGARQRLRDTALLPDLARRTIINYHIPEAITPELHSYVKQAVESAVEIVTQVELKRNDPVYPQLRDVVDTVGQLLDMICTMSDRIVSTEKLFNSIQDQVRKLPAARLTGDSEGIFNRNLFALQSSIDEARKQIVEATGSLQQIQVQMLMIQAQDAAMQVDITGSLSYLASNQSDLLQLRISAMDEIARTTEAATGKLLKRA